MSKLKFYEEGETCPNGCNCALTFTPVKNCSCHISAPCAGHMESHLHCAMCYWEEGQEITPLPPEAQASNQAIIAASELSAETETPETSAFMTRIDDSEIDLGMVESYMGDMEVQRNAARAEVERLKPLLKALEVTGCCSELLPIFEQAKQRPVYWQELVTLANEESEMLRSELTAYESRVKELDAERETERANWNAQAKIVADLRRQLDASQVQVGIDAMILREHEQTIVMLRAQVAELEKECERQRKLLNSPELLDFKEGVVLESAHQRERWASDHDAGKTPADWFWLVGYLAGKCLHAHTAGNTGKALHHTISTAAALGNWHAAIMGATNMRPGLGKETIEAIDAARSE